MSRIDHHIFRQPVLENCMELFAFESDFVASLRCIPMAVRFKLDLACIKVSLRQWSRFTLADRSNLLAWPCTTTLEIDTYRERLVAMIELRAGEAAKPIPLDVAPAWAVARMPPAVLDKHARSLGLNPPTAQEWSALTPLRRFTLLKLTRAGHDNVNFIPAMREFGLLAEHWMAATTAQAGLILAGGRSSRFGSDKAAALLDGRSLLAHAADALRRSCARAAVSAPQDSMAAYLAAYLGLETVCDLPGDPVGPFAGIRAGLQWAKEAGASRLLVRPVDTPLLPADLCERLTEAMRGKPAAFCVTPEGPQPLCSLWSVDLLPTLERIATSGDHPAMHRMLDALGAARLTIEDGGAFMNVNTRADLDQAEARLRA